MKTDLRTQIQTANATAKARFCGHRSPNSRGPETRLETSSKRLLLWLALVFVTDCSACLAQGTAFTYQGRLTESGSAYTGNVEFQATLWDAAGGGSQVSASSPAQMVVGVTNGLFVLPIDFGTNFPGADRWLQLEMRTAIGPFTTLTPRQPLTPAPYAIAANQLTGKLPATKLSGAIGAGNLSGTYTEAVTFNHAGNSFAGTGSGLTSLNASQLTSGTIPDARIMGNVARTNQVWLLDGNTATTPGTQFLGTRDNQPLEFKVNGLRVLRLEDNGDSADSDSIPDGAPNVIGGSAGNFVGAGLVGVTISGGGATYYGVGLAPTNRVRSDFGAVGGGFQNGIESDSQSVTIAGGYNNNVQTNSSYSAIAGGAANHIAANSMHGTIAGGGMNNITADSPYGTVAGGYHNSIGTNASHGSVGGGDANIIGASSDHGTIAGGNVNEIAANSRYATIAGGGENDIGTNSLCSSIGGGDNNNIADNSACATIPGGRWNDATNYAFAAGHRARAIHTGSFVWSDGEGTTTSSSAENSVTMRARGGFRFYTGSGSGGAQLAAGATSWSILSDRNVKKDFAPVDTLAILEKLAALPVTQWHYQWEAPDSTPHLGPVAQDFKTAFYPGRDDTSISTLEFDGVALAAIQGLNQKVDERVNRLEQELLCKAAENAALSRRLERLERLLNQCGGAR